jgi:hypothetical protein
MENYTAIIKSLLSKLDTYHEECDNGIVQPVYWSEDKNGNINFDVESMRDEFEKLLTSLEEYNDESEFDWDNF